jgi:hypothetical protein
LLTPRGNFDLVFVPITEGEWLVQISADDRAQAVLSPQERRSWYLVARHVEGAWLAGPPSCDFTLNGDLLRALRVSEAVASDLPACLVDSTHSIRTLAELESKTFSTLIVLEERTTSKP